MSREQPTYDVLGVPISAVDLASASAIIADWARDRRSRSVGLREVASIMALRATTELLAITKRTAMNLPDGMPVVWIGKMRGNAVGRVCGPDLFEKIILESPQSGLKHFLYGGKEGVAEILATKFRALAPGVEIVGTFCPPFRPLSPEEDARVIEMISTSGADIVWVGLSSPKQDIWMDTHRDSLPLLKIGVGAAFDFHAGTINRAPRWMQKSGFEWLHRLISEPKRLWRRYLILAPKFVGLLVLDWTRSRVLFRRKRPS